MEFKRKHLANDSISTILAYNNFDVSNGELYESLNTIGKLENNETKTEHF